MCVCIPHTIYPQLHATLKAGFKGSNSKVVSQMPRRLKCMGSNIKHFPGLHLPLAPTEPVAPPRKTMSMRGGGGGDCSPLGVAMVGLHVVPQHLPQPTGAASSLLSDDMGFQNSPRPVYSQSPSPSSYVPMMQLMGEASGAEQLHNEERAMRDESWLPPLAAGNSYMPNVQLVGEASGAEQLHNEERAMRDESWSPPLTSGDSYMPTVQLVGEAFGALQLDIEGRDESRSQLLAAGDSDFTVDGRVYGCGTNVFSLYADPERAGSWAKYSLRNASLVVACMPDRLESCGALCEYLKDTNVPVMIV